MQTLQEIGRFFVKWFENVTGDCGKGFTTGTHNCEQNRLPIVRCLCPPIVSSNCDQYKGLKVA
jgi:hypothetical protein